MRGRYDLLLSWKLAHDSLDQTSWVDLFSGR